MASRGSVPEASRKDERGQGRKGDLSASSSTDRRMRRESDAASKGNSGMKEQSFFIFFFLFPGEGRGKNSVQLERGLAISPRAAYLCN